MQLRNSTPKSPSSPIEKRDISWAKQQLENLLKEGSDLDKTFDYDDNRRYPVLPATKGQKPPEYMTNVELLAKAVDEEFREDPTGSKQFQRDAIIWKLTVRFPGCVARGNILRRIFKVLRYGGLIIQNQNGEFKFWYETGWPIATALSHGGRILIQLPQANVKDDKERDHSFWNWLITGDVNGDVGQYVSTSSNGDDTEKEGKLIFKRLGSTHGIVEMDDPIEVLGKHIKLREKKTLGFSLKDTKILGYDDYVLYHHRNWGMNLPIGGHGRKSLIGETITANGEHGHMYLYYQSPAKSRYGGILIGVEGSEYSKYDQVGSKHTMSAQSSKYSHSWGYKWYYKHKSSDGSEVDLSSLGGPAKYNGMFIDLSEGWEFIMHREWNDDMIMQTSEGNLQLPKRVMRTHNFKKDYKDYKFNPVLVSAEKYALMIS